MEQNQNNDLLNQVKDRFTGKSKGFVNPLAQDIYDGDVSLNAAPTYFLSRKTQLILFLIMVGILAVLFIAITVLGTPVE